MSDTFDFQQFLSAGGMTTNGNSVPQQQNPTPLNVIHLTEGRHPNVTYVGDSRLSAFSRENFSDTPKK